MMYTPELMIALLQIKEFYFTFNKINSGYFKAKVDGQELHLQSSHIIEVLRVQSEGSYS